MKEGNMLFISKFSVRNLLIEYENLNDNMTSLGMSDSFMFSDTNSQAYEHLVEEFGLMQGVKFVYNVRRPHWVKEHFRDGRLEAERDVWYDNGKPHRQEFYRNGNLEGARVWCENGQIKESQCYRGGKREGERKEWYENGQLNVWEFYRNGKRDGKHKAWYIFGDPFLFEFYRNGFQEGERKLFYDGKIWEYGFYRSGEPLIEKFTLDGKLAFCSLIRRVRKRINNSINVILISDLISIVCRY